MRTLKNGLIITDPCAAALDMARAHGTPFVWIRPTAVPAAACPNCYGLGHLQIETGHDDQGRPVRRTWPCPMCAEASALAVDERTVALNGVPASRRAYRLDWTRQACPVAGLQLQLLVQPQPAGWLWLQGSHGTGKTGAACALINALSQMGVPSRYTTVGTLMETLYAALHTHTVQDEMDKTTEWAALVLDEVDRVTGDWAHAQLFEILNRRYERRRSQLTIVVTNSELSSPAWAYMRDRLSDGTRITMTGASHRGRT